MELNKEQKQTTCEAQAQVRLARRLRALRLDNKKRKEKTPAAAPSAAPGVEE